MTNYSTNSLTLTIFPDVFATSLSTETISWGDLCRRVENPQVYYRKKSMPLIKLASFGDSLTDQKSYRHDSNVVEVYGIEGDYDAEIMSMNEAAKLLDQKGIEAILFTSPSATPEKPRWRVLAPLSKAIEPEERSYWTGMLNGALGGVLARESFTLSQSYYFGKGNNYYETIKTDGEFLDLKEGQWDPIYAKNKENAPEVEGFIWEDSVDQNEMVRKILNSEQYYEPLLKLSAALVAQGNKPRFIIDYLRRLMLQGKDTNTKGDWKQYYDMIEQMVRSAFDKWGVDGDTATTAPAAAAKSAAQPAMRIDLSTILDRELDPHPFIIENWLPKDAVTLFAANGGAGKSSIALQLAIEMATGGSFLGQDFDYCVHVVFISAEDNEQSLIRRMANYIKVKGINVEVLNNYLHIMDWSKKDSQVIYETDGRTGKFNKQFAEVSESCRKYDAEVLIVDNNSMFFGGNEIVRSEVQMYLSGLRKARPGLAVLALHHVDKASLKPGTGDGYSGSTAWHNGARARWSLINDNGMSVLTLQKSNYGKSGYQSVVSYDDKHHYFKVADGILKDKSANDVWMLILEMIHVRYEMGAYLSPSKTAKSNTNVKHVLMADPLFPKDINEKTIYATVDKLIMDGMLAEEVYKRDSKTVYRLALTRAGKAVLDEIDD